MAAKNSKMGRSSKSKKAHSVSKKGKTTVKRTSVKRKGKVTKVRYESTKEIKIEQALMDNFIALQKVMLNLSSKFDNLSSQIAKLLELFEISAKSLARKDFEADKENKQMKLLNDRLENIGQQAGLIGKGLALIHEVHREKGNPDPFVPGSKPQVPSNRDVSPAQNPMPKPMPQDSRLKSLQGYERSISSKIPKEGA